MDSSKRFDIGVNMQLIRLPPPIGGWVGQLDEEMFDENEFVMERKTFHPTNMDSEQRTVYKYIVDHPKEIVCLQAGTGCGKTFTLKTLMYASKEPVNVIIYKHNLLDTFRYNAHRYTVAKFMMQALGLTFSQLQSFDSLISSNLTSKEFAMVIVNMLRKFRLPDFGGSPVFIDEYTMISKPFLLVLLMLLEYHNIGAVICGDKNSLQNIRNSVDSDCSWYDIIDMYATKQFQLTVNKRCDDSTYNDLVEYLAQFSSDRPLDDFAYGILAALFPRQLIAEPQYDHIHLAPTNQELASAAHDLVCKGNFQHIGTEFYLIDQSRVDQEGKVVHSWPKCVLEYKECLERGEKPTVDTFLPYLPMVIGARYYVNEYSQGVLTSINEDHSIDVKLDNGITVNLKKNNNHHVMLNEHANFILSGCGGHIYCYPIYPANFMTIHKAQGCTITEKVDLMLASNLATYQKMYVALSRVTSPELIARVDIPNKIDHLVSAIVNFPELASNIAITRYILSERMTNFKHYKVAHRDDLLPFINDLCVRFLSSNDAKFKNSLRQEIVAAAVKGFQVIVKPPTTGEHWGRNHHLMTAKILKYKDVFLALACIDAIDRNVWLHEFVLSDPDLAAEGPSSISSFSHQFLSPFLVSFADLDCGYDVQESSADYIKRCAETKMRLPEEADGWKPYRLEELSTNLYLETSSKFCCKVYRMYKSSTAITLDWLVDEVNVMLSEVDC